MLVRETQELAISALKPMEYIHTVCLLLSAEEISDFFRKRNFSKKDIMEKMGGS
jgi:hypothetical protein